MIKRGSCEAVHGRRAREFVGATSKHMSSRQYSADLAVTPVNAAQRDVDPARVEETCFFQDFC